jgi:DNA-repair protein XRCC1
MAWQSTLTNIFTALNIKSCSVATVQLRLNPMAPLAILLCRYLLNEGRPWRHSSLAQVAQTVNIDDKKSGKETSCGSYGDIQQWVYQDLMSSISWLQQQEEKPTPEDLEAIAAQGILICLEDTIKGLQETSGVAKIVKDWGFVPHAVKKLAALEECGGSGKYNVVKEAERLHGIYAEELKKLSARSRASKRADVKKESEKEEQGAVKEDDVDDDATEVMSDEDLGEAVEQDDRRP